MLPWTSTIDLHLILTSMINIFHFLEIFSTKIQHFWRAVIQLNQRLWILPFGASFPPPYASTNTTTQWALLLPPHLTIEGVGRVTTLILVCNSWCSKSPKSTTKQPPSSHSPILPQLDLLYPPPVQQWVHHPPVWSLCVQQRTVWEKYPSTCKASLVKLGRVSSQIQVLFSTATVSKQAEGKRWVSTQQPSVSTNKTTMYPLHTHTQLFQQVAHLPPTFAHSLWWLFFDCFSFPPLTVSLFPPFLPLSITIQLWRWNIQAAKCALRLKSNWSAKCWAFPTKTIRIGVIDFKEAVNRNDFDMPHRKLHILTEWSHQLKHCKTTYIGRVESSWRRNSNYCCT